MSTALTLTEHAIERTSFDDIEAQLGIPAGSFLSYLKANPPAMAEYMAGVVARDANDENEVEAAILKRIKGYDVEETKYDSKSGREYDVTTHYPPDAKAGLEWLALRNRARWGKEAPAASGSVTNNFINSQVVLLQQAGLRPVAPAPTPRAIDAPA